jgi:hypothetical protein
VAYKKIAKTEKDVLGWDFNVEIQFEFFAAQSAGYVEHDVDRSHRAQSGWGLG